MTSVAVAVRESSFDPTLGYTQTPNQFVCGLEEKLGNGPYRLYTVLLRYCFNTNECYPGQQTLAQHVQVTVRTIRTYLKQLEQYGLLQIVRQGLRLPNRYILKLVVSRGGQAATSPEIRTVSPERKALSPEEPVLEEEKTEENQDLRISKPAPQIRLRPETESEPTLTVDPIAATAVQLSQDLGDSQHERSNLTQLTKLAGQSELAPQDFLAVVDQARQITLKRRQVWKGRNRMPYFFSVLINLLGIVEDKPAVLAPSAGRATVLHLARVQEAPAQEQDDTKSGEILGASGRAEPHMTQVWHQVQEQLRPTFSVGDYQTWLADTALLELEAPRAVVGAPTKYAVAWLQKRGVAAIEAALAQVVGQPLDIHFEHRPGLLL